LNAQAWQRACSDPANDLILSNTPWLAVVCGMASTLRRRGCGGTPSVSSNREYAKPWRRIYHEFITGLRTAARSAGPTTPLKASRHRPSPHRKRLATSCLAQGRTWHDRGALSHVRCCTDGLATDYNHPGSTSSNVITMSRCERRYTAWPAAVSMVQSATAHSPLRGDSPVRGSRTAASDWSARPRMGDLPMLGYAVAPFAKGCKGPLICAVLDHGQATTKSNWLRSSSLGVSKRLYRHRRGNVCSRAESRHSQPVAENVTSQTWTRSRVQGPGSSTTNDRQRNHRCEIFRN